MRILLIKLKHIGDCLLMTPTVRALRTAYPDAVIWCVVRRGSEEILAGCEGIDRVLTAVAPEPGKRESLSWLKDIPLALELRRQHFDLVLELTDGDRGRWLSLGSGGKLRATNARYDLSAFWRNFFHLKSQHDFAITHRVEKDFALAQEALHLTGEIPPLQFSKSQADFSKADEWKTEGSVLIHPATRWKRKQWPVERWAEICKRLHGDGRRMVISCGPSDEECSFSQEIIRLSGVGAQFTGGHLSWRQMAGLLFRANLFVGVDTAAMHLAAACQTPVVALFGPSIETHWRPWHCKHELIIPQVEKERLTRPDGVIDTRLRSMTDITVEQVWTGIMKMSSGS